MNKMMLLSALTLQCAQAFAAPIYEQNHDYIGFDAGYREMTGQGAWAPTFDKNFVDLNVFYGNQINSYLGYEFGYNWTDRPTHINVYQPSDIVFGYVNGTGSSPTTTAQARFKSMYLDFNLRIPLKPMLPELFRDVDLLLFMGVATSNINLVLSSNVPLTPIDPPLIATKGRAANHIRLGTILSIQVTQQSGVRLSYRWANTSRLRGTGPIASQPLYRQIFKDSHQVTAGLYYLF